MESVDKLGLQGKSAWSIATCYAGASFVVFACSNDARQHESIATDPTPRIGRNQPVDLTSLVERARLSFHGGQGNFESNAGSFVSTVHGPTTSISAAGGAGAQPASALTLHVSQIGRDRTLSGPQIGGTIRRPDGSVVTELGLANEVRRNIPDGLEQQWEFVEEPAGSGDIVIRVTATGQTPRYKSGTGLHFIDPSSGYGTRYGTATWIDANRKRTPIMPAIDGNDIILRVPEAVVGHSTFPAVLDPLVSPEIGIDKPVPSPDSLSTSVRVAQIGSTYLVVTPGIFATRVDAATGALLDPLGFTLVEPLDLQRLGAPPTGNGTPYAIATNGTDFCVVWGEARDPSAPTVMDIYARRIGLDGSVSNGPVSNGGVLIDTGGDQPSPEITYDGSHYYVVWRAGTSASGYEVRGARVDAVTLQKLDAQPTNTGLHGLGPIALATDGNTALMTAGTELIRARLNDGALADAAPQTFAASPSRGEVRASAAFDGKNYDVLWSGVADLHLSHVTPSGTLLEPPSSTSPGGISIGANPVDVPLVLSDGNDTCFVWNEYLFGLTGGRVDPDTGAALDGRLFDLGLPDPSGTSSVTAALSNGKVFVAGAGKGRRFDTVGMAPLGPAQIVQGNPNEAVKTWVASNGQDFLVVWTEGRRPYSGVNLFAARVASDGTVLDPDGIPLRIGTPALGLAVASARTDYLVAWVDWFGDYTETRTCATRIRASDGAMLDGTPESCGVVLDENPDRLPLWGVSAASDGQQYLLTWFPQFGNGTAGALIDPSADPLLAGVRNVAMPQSFGSSFFDPVAVAATPSTSQTAPSRFLIVTNGWGGSGTRANLLDPNSGQIGPTVQVTPPSASPGEEQWNLQTVSDGNDFLVTWADYASGPTGETLYLPMAARLSGSNGAIVAPAGLVRTTHPFQKTKLAYDGQHYWAAWLASDYYNDLYGDYVLATRMSTTGAFLDGPGATGAFEVSQRELMHGLGIAANQAGRVLAVYTGLSHSPLATRVYARFLEDAPSERDGGIVYHDASIPDVALPAAGGASSGTGGRIEGGTASGGTSGSLEAGSASGGTSGSPEAGSGGTGGSPEAGSVGRSGGTGPTDGARETSVRDAADGEGPADAPGGRDSATVRDAGRLTDAAQSSGSGGRASTGGYGGVSGKPGGDSSFSSGGRGVARGTGGARSNNRDGAIPLTDQLVGNAEGGGCDCRASPARPQPGGPWAVFFLLLLLEVRSSRRSRGVAQVTCQATSRTWMTSLTEWYSG